MNRPIHDTSYKWDYTKFVLCVLLLWVRAMSKLIHIIACVRTSFLWPNTIPLYAYSTLFYLFKPWKTVGLFWPFHHEHSREHTCSSVFNSLGLVPACGTSRLRGRSALTFGELQSPIFNKATLHLLHPWVQLTPKKLALDLLQEQPVLFNHWNISPVTFWGNSMFNSHVFLHVHVCVHVHVCGQEYICMHVCGSQWLNLGVFLDLSPLCISRQGLSVNLDLDDFASQKSACYGFYR